MIEALWGIAGSIVGAVVAIIIKELVTYIKSRRGKLSGEWYQIIYDEKGEEVKRDIVTCRHIGNKIEGEIRRIYPLGQSYKRWKFEGQVRERLFFGIFWTTDEIKNPNSYGNLQHNIIDANTMEGFYIKLILTSDGTQITQQLKPTPFNWKRKGSLVNSDEKCLKNDNCV